MALSFRLGRIPVRVQLWFFAMAVFLGLGAGQNDGTTDLRPVVSWVVIVFVSVLIHELGHALTGIAFGLQPRIDMHAMGGTTSWSTPKTLSTVQRVAISLAGPCAGFATWGVVYGLARGGALPTTGLWQGIYGDLFWVNVGWGVFNLLPMLPLDGGSVMTHLLNAWTHGHGERPARIVSMIVAGLTGGLVVLGQMGLWGVLLVLSFFSANYQGLKALRARESDEPMREALQQAYRALDARDAPRVLELARPVALSARTAPTRAEALQLLAFGFLLEGRVADADAAIAALPPGYSPHARLAEMRAAIKP